jgi:hypothetical protein
MTEESLHVDPLEDQGLGAQQGPGKSLPVDAIEQIEEMQG